MLHADTTTRSALRRRIDRIARRRWVLAALAALVSAALVIDRVDSAGRAQHSWGTSRVVAIARHDLAPGMTVGADDVTFERRPLAVLVDDVSSDPVGRRVADTIVAGEMVIDRRLIGAGRHLAGSLAEGSVFAVPIERSAPALAAGDLVDLWTAATRGSGALRAARRARVVSASERVIVVTVDRADADSTARAILDGTVVVALAGFDD
mgnify:CR=1 FL=1